MQFPENAAPGAPVAASAVGLDGRYVVAQAFEALYRFAFGLTGCEKDATELTEHACRSLLSKHDVPREARQLERFLFQALHRRFRGWRWQAARARKWFLGRVLPKSSSTPAPARDDSPELKALLQVEDDQYRAPLMLFYLGIFSGREMAEVLDLPVTTLQLRLERGKQLMRDGLPETQAKPVHDLEFTSLERIRPGAMPVPA